jgi:hypothetical protein
MTEILHGLVYRQELSIIGTVSLMARDELLRDECKGLPGVVNTLLQHGIHGGIGGVCDESKWRGWVGVRQ